jgi:hypothetical protein
MSYNSKQDLEFKLLMMEIESKKNEEPNYIDFEKLHQEKMERMKNHKDIMPDNLISGWILYLIVMIGGVIFYDYIPMAIIATLYFLLWRQRQIDIANGRHYED